MAKINPLFTATAGAAACPQADLAALVTEAHEKICPYSHATRNNVDVAFEVVGG